jgi:hypothetical protein
MFATRLLIPLADNINSSGPAEEFHRCIFGFTGFKNMINFKIIFTKRQVLWLFFRFA